MTKNLIVKKIHYIDLISILTIFIIINAGSGCSTSSKNITAQVDTPAPSWIITGHHLKYPKSFYMTAFGSSAGSAPEADDLARKELAKEIRVHLKGVDESIQYEISKINKDTSSVVTYSNTSSDIIAEVDITLEGVSIAERFYNKADGKYYSLAVLNRVQASSRLKAQISEYKQTRADHFRRGVKSEKQHDYVLALKNYIRAYKDFLNIRPVVLIRDIVTGEPEKSKEQKSQGESISDIKTKIENIVSGLKIIKLEGDNQRAANNEPLSELLTARIVYNNKKDEFPVENMRVLFSFKKGKGRLEREKITDSNGVVKARVESVEVSSNGTNSILLELDIARLTGELPGDILDYLFQESPYAAFSYTFPTTYSHKITKPQEKENGIKNLVSRIVNNIKREDIFKIAVLDFIEVKSKNRLRFSNLIEDDLKTRLAMIDNINISVIEKEVADITLSSSEKAVEMGATSFLTGGYSFERNRINITARLIDTDSGIILSAGQIVIKRDDVLEAELIIDDGKKRDKKEKYSVMLNRLIPAKPKNYSFKVDIWTEKDEYKIGETATFYFKAERDCYLTLLDIGTSGNLTFLFPNKYNPDNFIRAGKTYSIPGEEYGFTINVEGPPGIERIKAIATNSPVELAKMDFSNFFMGVTPSDKGRTRDLKINVDKLNKKSWSEDLHEIIIKPEKDKQYKGYRSIKIKPSKKPIDIIGTPGAMDGKKPRPADKPIDIIGVPGKIKQQK